MRQYRIKAVKRRYYEMPYYVIQYKDKWWHKWKSISVHNVESQAVDELNFYIE